MNDFEHVCQCAHSLYKTLGNMPAHTRAELQYEALKQAQWVDLPGMSGSYKQTVRYDQVCKALMDSLALLVKRKTEYRADGERIDAYFSARADMTDLIEQCAEKLAEELVADELAGCREGTQDLWSEDYRARVAELTV